MTNDERLDELERHYLGLIEALAESYRKAAQPFVERLLEIRNMRTPAYVIERDALLGLLQQPLPTSEKP